MKGLWSAVMVCSTLALVGCAGGQPMDYSDPSEIPPGPGLFAGASGEKVVPMPSLDSPSQEEAKTAQPTCACECTCCTEHKH